MFRGVKDALKREFFRFYMLGLRFGVHVIPAHYYSPVPDIRELKRSRGVWAKKSELPGIEVNLDTQVDALRRICAPYSGEYVGNEVYNEGVRNLYGPGYGFIEAQALHAVIRFYKPRRIVEVGGGVSTYCMLAALERNRVETGRVSRLVCIESHPSKKLKAARGIELVQENVQSVPLKLFYDLGEGDLLFIDSSHTVKPGSDVNYLILEVLPRLRKGVVVHFHDIYFPYDYQRDLLKTFLYRVETSLLRAFLINNDKAGILFSLSLLHYGRPGILKEVFPEYDPQPDIDGLLEDGCKPFQIFKNHFPSSTYIRIQ